MHGMALVLIELSRQNPHKHGEIPNNSFFIGHIHLIVKHAHTALYSIPLFKVQPDFRNVNTF